MLIKFKKLIVENSDALEEGTSRRIMVHDYRVEDCLLDTEHINSVEEYRLSDRLTEEQVSRVGSRFSAVITERATYIISGTPREILEKINKNKVLLKG